MRLPTQLLIGGTSLLLLAGCSMDQRGTSSAGFSRDEDAYSPPPSGTPGNSGTAAGTALFGNRPPGQLYGTSPFPPDGADPDSNFDNLEMASGLKSRLAVMRVGSDRTDGNLLSVFAGLKNKSAHRLPLEVQTIYKNKADQPLSDGRASWIPITLKPHEETQYRSVAISEDATDFLVRVRPAEDAKP